MDIGQRRYDTVRAEIYNKKPPNGRWNSVSMSVTQSLGDGWWYWIYSGDDLLFHGLSQSTIGDTGFPCLVRDGTEGGSRSIITRINPANIINFPGLPNIPWMMLRITAVISVMTFNARIILNVLFKHTVKTDKSQDDKIKSQWFD